jgi:hypothetical protein
MGTWISRRAEHELETDYRRILPVGSDLPAPTHRRDDRLSDRLVDWWRSLGEDQWLLIRLLSIVNTALIIATCLSIFTDHQLLAVFFGSTAAFLAVANLWLTWWDRS